MLIYILDDYEVNLYVFKELIDSDGKNHEVVLFKDAYQCLETIKGGRIPDVILTDILMPNMDGFEFTKLVKKDYNIKVVGITAANMPEVYSKGVESGMDSIVMKPISREKLLQQII